MSKSSIERIRAAECEVIDHKRELVAEIAVGLSDAHADADRAVGQASDEAEKHIAEEKARSLALTEKLVAEALKKALADAAELCRKASENTDAAIKIIIAEIAGK